MKPSFFLNVYCYIMVSYLSTSNGAKILGIFPYPSRSHFNYNNAIMKSLIEVGHQVTIITSFPQQASLENYTSVIDVAKDGIVHISRLAFQDLAKLTAYEIMNLLIETEKSDCYNVMNLPEIQNVFKSNEEPYDVIFFEAIFLHECFYPIVEKMRVPTILTMSSKSGLIADRVISNLHHPANIPYEYSKTWESNNFYGRLHNTWNMIVTEWYWKSITKPILQQFYENNTKLFGSNMKYTKVQPDLIFYNNQGSFLPRPQNPNVIEIGGIHIEPVKPLPEDLKKFIDEADHGVILFSFGSVARAAKSPQQILTAFREAFAEIPQRVIWKFEEPMENLSDNVMLKEWLPQRDILEHRNVKVFISHCGQGSVYEAINSATPVVAVPLFTDQPTNAAILKNLGVAIRLDINNISKQNILTALNEIVNNTRYFKTMQKLSMIFKDRPITPQQSVVYWTEYLIRHSGANHLKTAATRLNWFQYLLLDVLCFIFLISVTTIYIIIYVTKILNFNFFRLKKMCRKFKNKDQ